MPEETPLPLARMVSVKNPVFWIFLAICAALYAYDKFAGARGANADSIYGDCLFGAVFIALFLTIIADSAKTPSVNRALNICCYAFEAAAVLVLGILILK